MIDGFVNSLRRAGELVQRRGEEVAQTTRLRVEVFQLGRELDSLYARLGRAYHSDASLEILEEIRGDIARVDQEIGAKEALIRELNEPQDEPSRDGGDEQDVPTGAAARATPPPPVGRSGDAVDAPPTPVQATVISIQPSPPSSSSAQPAVPRSTADAALSVWREKEASRMTSDQDSQKAPAPNPENADPLDPTKAGATRAPDAPPTDIPVGKGDVKVTPADKTASMGDEAARDGMVRHENMLKEGAAASRDPDPLANKGE